MTLPRFAAGRRPARRHCVVVRSASLYRDEASLQTASWLRVHLRQIRPLLTNRDGDMIGLVNNGRWFASGNCTGMLGRLLYCCCSSC